MDNQIARLITRSAALPREMREADRWLLWKSVKNDKPGKKPRKVPFYANGKPRNGDLENDLHKLVSLDVALKALRSGQYAGLGFALGRDEFGMYWQGIDFDDIDDHGLTDLSNMLPGYVEASPSGKGCHAIGYGPPFESATNKKAGIEFYSHGRFFTVTGDSLRDPIFEECKPVDLEPFIDKHLRPLVGSAREPSRAIAVREDDWAVEDVSNQRVDDLTDDEIRAVLMTVPAQAGYHDWMQVGMALYHQFDGDERGLELWHEWSEAVYGDDYDPDEIDEKWERGKLGVDGKRKTPTTARLILKLAGDDGKEAIRELRGEETAATIDDLRTRLREAEDEDAVRSIADDIAVTEMDALTREQFANTIVSKFKAFGLKVPLPAVRKLIRFNGELGTVKMGQQIGSFAFPHLTEEGRPKSTLANFRFMLETYGVSARYNVMQKKPEFVIPGMSAVPEEYDNAAFAELESLCELNNMGSSKVVGYALNVAAENPHHPIVDWITSKPWDRKSRLAKFYDTVQVEEGYPIELRDMLIYRWMISAVAAIFKDDGFESRGVLVFTGDQSIGKTRWIKRLVPTAKRAILDGATIDPESRDSTMVAVMHWIVELGELDGLFRKADIARLKAFVTRPFDKMRRAYAKAESEYQRRTVFCASVNDPNFLVDETGNTRWWTIAVTALDYNHKIDMQQVWAEIYHHYLEGERWYLTKDEEAQLSLRNEDHEVVDPLEEKILTTFDWGCDRKDRWRQMTATEILDAIGYDKPNKGQAGAVGRIVKKLNGKQAIRIGVDRKRCHMMPPRMQFDDDEAWRYDPAADL